MDYTKILQITADDFLKQGLSTSQDTVVGGLFWEGEAIDPWRKMGTLTQGYLPSQIASATIVDTINWFIPTNGNDNYVFAYGYSSTTSAGIYRINVGTDGVEKMYGVSGSAANGFEMLGGKIYYACNGEVGEMTNYGGALTAAVFTTPKISLTATGSAQEHPLHTFYDKMWIGDGPNLDSWDGTTAVDGELGLRTDYNIVDIDDDGSYLVIAAQKKGGTGITRNQNKAFFWDMVSDSWNAEWELPEGKLTGISKLQGNQMIAFCGENAYVFSISSFPQPLFDGVASTAQSYLQSADLKPYSGAIHYWRGGLAWASNGAIFIRGKVLPGLNNIVTKPTKLANIKSFYIDNFARVYASTTANALHKISTGYYSTGYVATGFIQFDKPWHIQKIKVHSATTLSATATVQIQLTNEAGIAMVDKTLNSTTHGDSKRVFTQPVDMITNGCGVVIYPNSGTSIRKVELWGVPYSDEFTS